MWNQLDPMALVGPNGLAEGLRPRPPSLNPDVHTEIVRRVVSMYRACKRDQASHPSHFQPGGEWVSYIAERSAFYDLLMSLDLDLIADWLNNFWRNQLGPIVKEYANYDQLVNRTEPFTTRFQCGIARNYLTWKEIFNQPPERLDVPNIGNSWGCVIEGRLVAPKATRFSALAERAKELVRGYLRPVVAEIGGGYGGMAYYLLRDASNGLYLNFDLPETLVLAAYYILCCLPAKRTFLYGETRFRPETLRNYDACFLPNYVLPRVPDEFATLVLNSFGLSEVTWPILEEYMRQIARISRCYFLHNNMDRPGVVHRGFERVPASAFPVDRSVFRMLYKQFDLFQGHDGDYREFLFEKIHRVREVAC